jgi:DNA-binding GntR family transcriptional regulator
VVKLDGRGYAVRPGGARRQPRPSAGLAPAEPDFHEGERLQSAASWERIYDQVEDKIITRIAFGSWRLNEAALGRSHEVSRTVAREVLTRLQERGLIRKDDRARWFAPALTPDHLREHYEVRWLLEPTALVKAAAHVPVAVVDWLIANLQQAMAHQDTIDGATLDRLETDLHRTLLGHCRNQTLLDAIAHHHALLIAHRYLYRWTFQLFGPEPFLPEHMEVFQHLRAGRVADAAAGLEHHLRVSADRVADRVEAIRARFSVDELPYLQLMDGG